MDELPEEVEALRKVRFFEDLTPEDLDRVAKVGERRTFEAGQHIVEKGGAPLGLYVILSGTATVEAGGKTHTLAPGDFFGEMALLGARPRTATVVAAEPVETMEIKAIHFRPFLVKNCSVAVEILRGVVERLREVQERLERAES
jgi:CRP-like cAMP-binding protein